MYTTVYVKPILDIVKKKMGICGFSVIGKKKHDMSGNVSNWLLPTNSENAFLLKFTVILTTPLS